MRTSALGEDVERAISFDVATIVRDGIDQLHPTVRPASPATHFTEITLIGLHQPPQTKTIGKIKDHLASIFRVFLRDGTLELWFNKEQLVYQPPKVLRARYYRDETGEPVEWRKDISFDLGGGQTVHGFAAIRETASTSEAGFGLFRNRRLIVGSKEEGYRPIAIFGRSNSYTYQRLFGELHLEGLEVTQTKDGFQWDADEEEAFLGLLHDHLDAEPLPLLKQTEGHRVRPKPNDPDLKKSGEEALNNTARVTEEKGPSVIQEGLDNPPPDAPPPEYLPNTPETTIRMIPINLKGVQWEVVLQLTRDDNVEPWIDVAEAVAPAKGNHGVRRVEAKVGLTHPFMVEFAGTDREKIEPLIRVAAGIALAEVMARESGVKRAATIRMHLNALLRHALAEP